jgi:hypothetical protein
LIAQRSAQADSLFKQSGVLLRFALMIQAKLRTLSCHSILEVDTRVLLRESYRGAIMATDI